MTAHQPIAGSLYIIATPIGHLDDITYRAVELLRQVDYIMAEDTRHSRRLLDHYHIQTPLRSLHDHNEAQKVQQVIAQLQAGQSIALISDAGTPLISDPGYRLVNQAHLSQCRVIPIPGPCAAIAALSASGLPTQRFSFEGFLPARAAARQAYLHTLQQDPRTLIFYEAPHRLLAGLTAIQTCLGSHRQAVLARELTKTFETIYSAPLIDLVAWVKQDTHRQKGECVILVQGASDQDRLAAAKHQALALLKRLTDTLPKRDAIQLTADITGYPKNELYRIAHIS